MIDLSVTSVNLTAPPTNIGTTTPPAITVSTLFRSANSGNAPFVANPSGTGAFQLQATDNTATGGNVRGANATDLQTIRSAATQVASGLASFAAGQQNTATGNSSVTLGQGNTASATWSVALGVSNLASGQSSVTLGQGNTASATWSVALGVSNLASGQSSVALGQGNIASVLYSVALGVANTANGQASVALGENNIVNGAASVALGQGNTTFGPRSTAIGESNTASGSHSIALGNRATTKSISSMFALGNLIISDVGKSQTPILGLGAITTNATATVLKSDLAAVAATNQFALQDNSSITFTGLITATTTNGGDCSSWEFKGMIQRGASAATTALVAAVTPVLISQKAGAAGWVVAVTTNTTLGCLTVTVTGQAATTIRWNCSIFSSEVAF